MLSCAFHSKWLSCHPAGTCLLGHIYLQAASSTACSQTWHLGKRSIKIHHKLIAQLIKFKLLTFSLLSAPKKGMTSWTRWFHRHCRLKEMLKDLVAKWLEAGNSIFAYRCIGLKSIHDGSTMMGPRWRQTQWGLHYDTLCTILLTITMIIVTIADGYHYLWFPSIRISSPLSNHRYCCCYMFGVCLSVAKVAILYAFLVEGQQQRLGQRQQQCGNSPHVALAEGLGTTQDSFSCFWLLYEFWWRFLENIL